MPNIARRQALTDAARMLRRPGKPVNRTFSTRRYRDAYQGAFKELASDLGIPIVSVEARQFGRLGRSTVTTRVDPDWALDRLHSDPALFARLRAIATDIEHGVAC